MKSSTSSDLCLGTASSDAAPIIQTMLRTLSIHLSRLSLTSVHRRRFGTTLPFLPSSTSKCTEGVKEGVRIWRFMRAVSRYQLRLLLTGTGSTTIHTHIMQTTCMRLSMTAASLLRMMTKTSVFIYKGRSSNTYFFTCRAAITIVALSVSEDVEGHATSPPRWFIDDEPRPVC